MKEKYLYNFFFKKAENHIKRISTRTEMDRIEFGQQGVII